MNKISKKKKRVKSVFLRPKTTIPTKVRTLLLITYQAKPWPLAIKENFRISEKCCDVRVTEHSATVPGCKDVYSPHVKKHGEG